MNSVVLQLFWPEFTGTDENSPTTRGQRASDVSMVRPIGDVKRGLFFILQMNGHHHGEVREMRAACKGIVQRRDVTGL